MNPGPAMDSANLCHHVPLQTVIADEHVATPARAETTVPPVALHLHLSTV